MNGGFGRRFYLRKMWARASTLAQERTDAEFCRLVFDLHKDQAEGEASALPMYRNSPHERDARAHILFRLRLCAPGLGQRGFQPVSR